MEMLPLWWIPLIAQNFPFYRLSSDELLFENLLIHLQLMERKEMKDRQILGLYCKDRLKKAVKFTLKLRISFFCYGRITVFFLVFFIYTWETSALLIPHRKKNHSMKIVHFQNKIIISPYWFWKEVINTSGLMIMNYTSQKISQFPWNTRTVYSLKIRSISESKPPQCLEIILAPQLLPYSCTCASFPK